MPLFEFYCTKCGQILEALLVYPPPDVRPCTCGSEAHRTISAPVIRFNGGGWTTPRAYNDKPWEGTPLENGGVEASRDFMDERRKRGYIPDRETKITVDMRGGG